MIRLAVVLAILLAPAAHAGDDAAPAPTPPR
jgi:hypothetical protein